jgi:hypothetical protein
MDANTLGYRFLLVGRALLLGGMWGAAFGALTYAVLGVASVVQSALLWIGFAHVAALVGAVVGGSIAVTSGLALALSSQGVLRQLCWARLVAGGAAAAVPLAVVLNLPGPGTWSQYVVAAGIAGVAAVTAALLTPRIVHGPPAPPAGGFPMPPVLKPPTLTLRRAAEHDEPPGPEPEASFRRRLVVGRGLGWGMISGTALGCYAWTAMCVEAGEFRTMSFVGVAAVVGAALGACLGLATGLALALSGQQVLSRMYRAQLVAGGVATALPVAVVAFARPRSSWTYAYLLSPVNLAVVAGLTAVLLTPRIVLGSPGCRAGDGTGRSGVVR